MDHVQGELLIYKIKEVRMLERKMLFDWMLQLLHQLQCYQRCHSGRNYRYTNPYSVLIARDGKILLLDLDAKSNEFVMKNMQKRAMRNHFVKPVLDTMKNREDTLDIYGYGKTIQFMLANINTDPSLTRFQEYRLEKLINKCLDEKVKKKYEELKQIEKDLFFITESRIGLEWRKFAIRLVTGLLIVLVISAMFHVHKLKKEQEELQMKLWELERIQEEVIEARELHEEVVVEDDIKESTEEEAKNPKEEEDIVAKTENADEIEKVLTDEEKLLTIYEQLIQSESNENILKTAYFRKITLEAELLKTENAKKTVEEFKERFPDVEDSEELLMILETYNLSDTVIKEEDPLKREDAR